jgi:uncharacterized protein (TIGR03437 family)
MKRTRIALAFLLACLSATAHYHFVRYTVRGGYQQPIYERFDLNALVNKTVPFFLVGDGLERVAPGDNPRAVMSQIILAAKTWSDVSTSDLRIAFGGYAPAAAAPSAASQSAPGIDIVFDDVPPGIISYAGPTVKAETTNSNEPFTPILRSLIVFRKDLSNIAEVAYPSFSEAFFLNAVHEFGHALGLQHTFTSGAMSTQLTRASTRSRPLNADDVAAISILYPARNFSTLFGTVAGRVLQNGVGVNLASVVLLSLNGTSISALTNPDGTYRIQGVPPGPYMIYTHPVPPAVTGEVTPGNIVLPRDPDNNLIGVNNLFDTQFYPGVRDTQNAITINVAANQTVNDITFNVNRRATPPTLFYPTTYSYFGSTSVRPAFITPAQTSPLFIATGFGFVTTDSRPVAGLRAQILGGSPAISQTRGFQSQFIIFDLSLSGFLSDGPRHMLLDNGAETHVLPAALHLATRRPPDVASVNWIVQSLDGARTAQAIGTGFVSQSRVFVDGEEAPVRGVDEAAGIITFAPPAAAAGHVGRVIVLNPDGQSSLFLRPTTPAQLPYTEADAASFQVSPTTANSGSELIVEINAPGARFQAGQVTLGFGSSDIVVRSMTVASPNRILASVVVAPSAAAGNYTVTVQSGLNHLQLRGGFQVQPSFVGVSRAVLQPDSRWTTDAGSAFVTPGSNAIISVNGLNAASPRVTATLNDQPINVISAGSGRVTVQVPAGLTPGLLPLRLTVDGELVNPVLVQIAGAAPSIQRVEGSDLFVIDSARPAFVGDNLTITFTDPSTSAEQTIRAGDVMVLIGETPVFTLRVQRIAGNGGNTFQTTIQLPRGFADGTYSLSIQVNGRASSNSNLLIRNR